MTASPRSLIIHAHLYQPPREDPWLGQIARESSAAPYHDWNERILAECYRAIVSARVPDVHGRALDVVNTLSFASFNVGPTLMQWLEGAAPHVYRAILAADAAGAERCGGHGNAIAMPYHHVILPLATRRDKVTEVRWGIADFRRRFGRAPEGMWLPETAVDDETLDVLAAHGIRFTILAPHQVRTPPPTGLPARYRTGSGREIAVFCYDGGRSHDVAFGAALRDGSAWADRLLEMDRQLVLIATDGETFGHHHTFGEMALATLAHRLRWEPRVVVENCAAALARAAATADVQLVEDSSWSCVHGVERWRGACGCRMHPERHTQQEWRSVLRQSLDWLAGELHAVYDVEARQLSDDPWTLRDDFGWAVAHGDDAVVAFVRERAPGASAEQRVRLAELLELERNALRMFTSCGWFFDDIGGLESRQVLRYAARAIELAGPAAPRLEAGLQERLALAHSNEPRLGTGAAIYVQGKPRHPPPVLAAACAALADRFGAEQRAAVPASFGARVGEHAGEACIVARQTSTGREWCVPATVNGNRIGDVTVDTVDPIDGTSRVLRLADLPESAQRAIARHVTHSIVAREIEPDESKALLAGDALPAVVSSILQRRVEELGGAATRESISRVLDLLDVLDLLEHPFPYDAKTALFDAWRSHAGEDELFRPIARRLGFV